MVQTADVIFRDFATDGIPASGKHEPRKVEIREWGALLEAGLNGLASNSGLVYQTRAELNANLNYPSLTMVWVVADPAPANNGIYQKLGASGSGSWLRLLDLPYSFIRASDVGAGTPNAIQATTSVAVPSADAGALIALNVFETNTGSPVTVSFNGGATLTIKTNAGNDVAVGGLTSGMIVAGYVSGSTFRLLSDQASAAIVAAAEAAQAAAEAARDQAVAAAATVTAPKATVALAIADDPAVDPEYYDIAYFDTAYQTGSGAKWRKVAVDPGLVAGAAFQNANLTWYVNDSEWLKPEQFGRIGVDAATDTAAWVRLVAAANYRGGKLKVRLANDLNLNGTGTASDSQTFTNFSSIWIRGNDVEVYQRNSLSKTFKFIAANAKTKVTGVELVGYAEQQINAAITPNEIDFALSSGNAVAAIYAEDLEELYLNKVTTRNHAGRDVHCAGVLHLKGRDLDLVGLGPVYNDPIRDAHQGNGEDAAIYHIPKPGGAGYYEPTTTTAWRQTLDVCNSRIKWHSFCIRTILNKAIILHGNQFDYTPGQHHVYDSDSDGHSIIGNQFGYCRQIAYKTQLENIAGLSYGAPYDANKVGGYAVGDVVRAFSILWICKTAYTPAGAAFSSANWNEHPRYKRRGGVWQGNTFDDCVQGVGVIENTQVYGLNIWTLGYVVTGNTFNRCGEAIYMDRCWEATVAKNNTHGSEYGFYGRNFSGTMKGNDFWDTGKNCILIIGVSKASKLEGNTFGNYGQTGTDDPTRSAVYVLAPNADAPPAKADVPRVFFGENAFMHYVKNAAADTADAPGGLLVISTDAACVWEIEGTHGTPTTKLFRIDGTVEYQHRNHFPGFFNTAQNLPLWTLSHVATRTIDGASTTSNVRDALATLVDELAQATRRITRRN